MIEFINEDDGIRQIGEPTFKYGRFQWLKDNGSWDGGWTIEPVSDLIDRMRLGGPYKYDRYRIVPATKAELNIKAVCAGCGAPAGIDCQRTCEYMFGPADVLRAPIEFDEDHQFPLIAKVATKGRNFGVQHPKLFWFNSVRCAELFIIEHGFTGQAHATIGDGTRLAAYLGTKSRKPSRYSLEYRQAQMRLRESKAIRTTEIVM